MSSLCKHFGVCGGCSFQDIPYALQLNKKQHAIKELANAYELTCEIKPINTFQEWFYRNKMEFTFGGSIATVCGMYKKDSRREVFDLEECRIFTQDIAPIITGIREFVKANNYSAYNKYNYKGFLRNLIVRQTKFTRKTMLGLVTTSQVVLDKEGLLKQLCSLRLEAPIASVYHITNDSWSDFIVYEKKELLYGEPTIFETLDGLQFSIAIDSFFQINSSGIQALYNKIRHYAKLTKTERVLDLCCGAGGIGMFLAKDAHSVVGVELDETVVAHASHNAHSNGINNISFIASDVRKYLNGENKPTSSDVVVINPPRSGISNKVKRAIMRLDPKIIMYSSCNPETLCRDLKDLSLQYTTEFLEPFDFFPHTRHVECLALLFRSA